MANSGTLRSWLCDNLYRHGSKFVLNDLVKRAAGAAMKMTPYFDYLREKYGVLYRLPAGSVPWDRRWQMGSAM